MTLAEKIKRFDEITAQADELVQQAKLLSDEIKAEQEEESGSPIKKYIRAIARKAFCLSANRAILSGSDFDGSAGFGFCALYPDMDYAYMACGLKKWNDLLLAFKYSHDKDFIPNFNDEDEDKFYVVWNAAMSRYDTSATFTDDINTVYFSTQQIARECADWFNGLCDKGEL